jgi:hypothetical protein
MIRDFKRIHVNKEIENFIKLESIYKEINSNPWSGRHFYENGSVPHGQQIMVKNFKTQQSNGGWCSMILPQIIVKMMIRSVSEQQKDLIVMIEKYLTRIDSNGWIDNLTDINHRTIPVLNRFLRD